MDSVTTQLATNGRKRPKRQMQDTASLSDFNHRRTHLDVDLEGVLVCVAQTAHVLQVCSRDGETKVDVRWFH